MADKDPKTGRFVAGNKGGGRKKMPDDIKEAFRKLTPKALMRLEEMINDPDCDRRVLIDAIKTVLDRAYGKPAQSVDLDTGEGITINVKVTGNADNSS